MKISIIIPAKNEEVGLAKLLPTLCGLYASAEIIVVNDGSEDNTSKICDQYGVTCIDHLYSKGNGAAIKSGARHASGDVLVFMDADGQHDPAYIDALLKKIADGADMAVGARSNASQAGIRRLTANKFYNGLASWVVGHKIADLTSGLRAVRRELFIEFIHLLPNGFSYPTTITMAFFKAGYSVAYLPIEGKERVGKSHIRLVRDGIRFLLIIFKIGTLYSPLKIFLPVSVVLFVAGLLYYMYTFITEGRFTNMSALLFSSSLIIFMMGLVSEQVNSLQHARQS